MSTLILKRFSKKLILTPLAQTRDAELLATQLVAEIGGRLATRHTRLAGNGKSTAAAEEVESEVVLEVIQIVHRANSVTRF